MWEQRVTRVRDRTERVSYWREQGEYTNIGRLITNWMDTIGRFKVDRSRSRSRIRIRSHAELRLTVY